MKETEYDTQTNGKIYRAHGLKEQTVLRQPFYPRQSID